MLLFNNIAQVGNACLKFSLHTGFACALLLFSNSGQAATFSTMDLFVFTKVQISSGGGSLDLAPGLISDSLASPGAAVDFAAGSTFTPTTAFNGRALDASRNRISNTTSTAGVLSKGADQFFSVLVASDLDKVPETLGMADLVELNLTHFLPPDVAVGDIGTMDYTMIQFTRPIDTSPEVGLSALETLVMRGNNGQAQMLFSGSDPQAVFGQPFIVATGSSWWRWVGKGLVITGSTAGGALGGAAVGTVALPLIGTVSGTVLGGIGAAAASTGAMILENTKDDETSKDKTTPAASLTPSSLAMIPEPATWAMFCLGFGLIGSAIRRQRLTAAG